MNITEGFTYDDVLLIPQKSAVDHRSQIDTTTSLTRNIKLHIPFISANMDSVTEGEMAIALAREGGIGIVHRFMTIEREVGEVVKVKRHEGFILEDPYMVTPDTTLAQVLEISRDLGVKGFIVVDAQKKLQGILTRRDYRFESSLSTSVSELMTPASRMVTAAVGLTFAQAKKIFRKNKVEKIPLLDPNGVVRGLITARSVLNYEKHPFSTKDRFGRYRVGAAVGVVNDYLDRAKALIKSNVDVLVVDVAHGHNDIALRAVGQLRRKFPGVDIIGGNVATPRAAADLARLGVDAVKVGIGPGGLCTTRVVAGVGVPQLTAVSTCAQAVRKYKIPVIADGGTNHPGDLTKALAAGGSSCMLAGWFAGTDESPGGIIYRNGMKYKVHRGSASFMATADRKLSLEQTGLGELNKIVPEGVEALVPYKGSVVEVIRQLLGALKSGMSYCNAESIPKLWTNARFIKITEAGLRESKSHNIQEI